MPRFKFVSMAVLLALVVSAWPNAAQAEKHAPPPIPGLDGPVEGFTRAELAKLVDLAFAEQITVEQTQGLYEQLTAAQKGEVGELVAIRAGVPLGGWRREIKQHRQQISAGPATSGPGVLFAGELWRQYIENAWTIGIPAGSAFAYYADINPLCEGGSNPDPDNDWVFYYSMDYQQNPDYLRWTATSSQVYLAFMSAYGGNLNGYAFSWSEVRLCLGTVGVAAAGGPTKVQSGMFLWHAY